MKILKIILIVVLVIAIVCGVTALKLGSEKKQILGTWTATVNGGAVLKNIIDFSTLDDVILWDQLNSELDAISVPLRVQFFADRGYQISVDQRDAEIVTEAYVTAVRSYLVEYAKKNISEIAGQGVSNAANIFKNFLKNYLDIDIGSTADQLIASAVDRMMTDNFNRTAIAEKIQRVYAASGSYRVAFGKLYFSGDRMEDIRSDNTLRYKVSDSQLTLNKIGKNAGGFSVLLGIPLKAA